jgi:type IV secretory pathway protease TraF
LAHPENTQKAQENSPIIKRSRAQNGDSKLKTYKTIKVNGKWVREHRWLMEQHLGRKLETWEQVHHIDGNHLNNAIENLEVLSNADHQRKELEQWMNPRD